MVWSILDLLEKADPRTVLVVLVSIGLSHLLGLFTVVPFFRWIASSLRLRLLLRKKSNNSKNVSVSGIFVHPVKSMRSISLQESTLDRKGLQDDRRFMVVYELPLPVYRKKWQEGDTTHRFLTQRQCPSLATISATIVTRSTERFLVLEQQAEFTKQKKQSSQLEIPLGGTVVRRKKHLAGIWDDLVAVDDMGDEAAAFLQAIADADDELAASSSGSSKKIVRLVTESLQQPLSPARDERKYVPSYAKTWNGGFLGKPTLTDGFPILIASEASLEALNQKLMANGKESIPMSRFRPNIVVRGSKPFEEDRWKVIVIGTTVFAIVKACPRCKQSCTDQVTGTVSPQMEPLTTMASFRRSLGDEPANGSVFFAQNAIPIGSLEGKTIRVGDSVEILETGDPVYID